MVNGGVNFILSLNFIQIYCPNHLANSFKIYLTLKHFSIISKIIIINYKSHHLLTPYCVRNIILSIFMLISRMQSSLVLWGALHHCFHFEWIRKRQQPCSLCSKLSWLVLTASQSKLLTSLCPWSQLAAHEIDSFH